ncbi:ATP-grasp domain-containing protein [Armatimonas rosea]|uniref:Biotin carboxylase n=1 Tax=Armatimonas rosea TaxID=685828 RepID=A0A7W9SU16_ARMRO|nr:ATP-grasp domain-containing protein [Armatimonas rosea]MBB6052033.1 biotin carboxylase [Armatimonas rosea]
MKTVLAIASFEKGQAFLRQCKAEGCRTLLLTSQSLENGDWPRECLDDIYFMPDVDKEWNLTDMIHAVSYLARTVKIDKIVPLDDFDVEKAALLREHLRLGGMGDTTARYFRDKLAMRAKARDGGLPIPRFVGVLNYDDIRAFMAEVPPPYVLKPRTQAGAIGIKKVESEAELWPLLEALGDRQSYYLLEEFLPGTIWHVDSIVDDKRVVWALVSRYARPPLEVSHEGRVFCTQNVPYGSVEEKALKKLNATVLKTLGLVRGVSHTEYIQSAADGRFYFLETSARVGGAHIAEMIEAASGLNLWAEWAKLEVRESYTPEPPYKRYAGLLVSLAKQEEPDLSGYDAPEIWWQLKKKHHAGVVLASESHARISELLTSYTERFYQDFFQRLPPKEKATD